MRPMLAAAVLSVLFVAPLLTIRVSDIVSFGGQE